MKRHHVILLIIAIILLCLFFGFLLFGINSAYLQGYEQNLPANTMFSASDWISFAGSLGGGLLGAVLAIFGVFWTLQNNQKLNKDLIIENKSLSDEANRKSVLPVIAINILLKSYEGNVIVSLLADMADSHDDTKQAEFIQLVNDIQYKENRIDSMFFVINSNKIDVKDKLNRSELIAIRDNWKLGIISNNGQSSVAQISYVPCFVVNCGNGAAVNTIFRLSKAENSEIEECISIPINLKKDAEFKLGFYCDLNEGTKGKYLFIIDYYNIFGEKYSQTHELLIDQENATISTQITQNSP